GIDQGRVSALRQVVKTADQCATWAGQAGEPSFFATLISGARDVPGVTDALRTQLETGAVAAATAYGDLGHSLRTELAPKAPKRDAVGAEAYGLWLRYFTGATVDLAELYQ